MFGWDNPDFVNDEGVKWWKENIYTSKPKDTMPYRVELMDGSRSRVIICGGKIVYHNGSMDAIAARLDMMKLAEGGIRMLGEVS